MLLNYYRRQAVAQYAQTCKTKQEDNKMKKLVALAMSLTMAFSLVACGNSDASNTNTSTDAAATTVASTEATQQLLQQQPPPRLHSRPLPLRSRTFP